MMQKQLSGIKAAELGNADAITNLGIMYENGEGVKRTIKQPTFIRLLAIKEKKEAAITLQN